MSRRRHVLTHALALPCIALVGCSSEPTLEETVVGTWEKSDLSGKTLITFRADHIVELEYDVVVLGKGKATGKWTIEDRKLVYDITESDRELLKNLIEEIEIVRVDDTSLVYRDGDGDLGKYVRRRK